MNTKAVGTTVQEVVDSIASSNFAKNLIPSTNEIDSTLAGMASKGKYFKITNDGITSAATSTKSVQYIKDGVERYVNSSSADAQTAAQAKKLISGINVSNAEDILSQLEKLSPEDQVLSRHMARARQQFSKEDPINAGNVKYKMGGIVNYYANMPVAYFNNPDKTIRDSRIKTAIGGYATLAIGGRIMSGGSLTADSYGRKDIAGVPFL